MFEEVIKLAAQKKVTIKTMESCTGGAVVSALTDVEGASSVVKESFVTYCNESKISHGVDAKIISRYTVYSKETAAAMAKACRQQGILADIGIGVTGNFGNMDPYNKAASTPGKVYFAIANQEQVKTYCLALDPKQNRKVLKARICQEIDSHLLKLLKER